MSIEKNQIGFKRRKFVFPKIREIVRKFDQQFSAPESVNWVVVIVAFLLQMYNKLLDIYMNF